jgi:hypothetical protein
MWLTNEELEIVWKEWAIASRSIVSAFACRNWGELRKHSIGIHCVPTETRTERLPEFSLAELMPGHGPARQVTFVGKVQLSPNYSNLRNLLFRIYGVVFCWTVISCFCNHLLGTGVVAHKIIMSPVTLVEIISYMLFYITLRDCCS